MLARSRLDTPSHPSQPALRMTSGGVAVDVFQDSAALTHAAAERVAAHAREATTLRGRFDWVLAGGRTPRPLYSLLGTEPYRSRLDWQRVHFFWSDERCVPPEHPNSNYRMVKEGLLDLVPLPTENVHRMRGEDEPEAAADTYTDLLRTVRTNQAGTPRFDLILLGMGSDGHTASLFPGAAALRETTRWVVPSYVEKLASFRLTLTAPVINAAAHVLFLVQGADKSARVAEVLGGPSHENADDQETLPVRFIHPEDGDVRWLLDADAASLLPNEPDQERMPS